MMSKDTRTGFSEEFLNSFVDNQLSAEEKSQAYLEIGHDPDLNRQVCELRKMHDLVQLAYQNVPPPPITRRRTGNGRFVRYGIAASVLLAVGIALGLHIELPGTHKDSASAVAKPSVSTPADRVATKTVPTTRRAASIQASNATAEDAPISLYAPRSVAAPSTVPTSKVMVHITYNEADRVHQALNEVEELLHHYRDNQQHALVEIVVNGRGLDVLRRDTSRFAARIAHLQKDYDNLTLAACQNSIDRIKREQGITVRLLPGVMVIDSGMAEIMRRQVQGWAYLQV